MNQYLLIANDEHSHESTELGTIRANSLSEAALFLAYHFPNHRLNFLKINIFYKFLNLISF